MLPATYRPTTRSTRRRSRRSPSATRCCSARSCTTSARTARAGTSASARGSPREVARRDGRAAAPARELAHFMVGRAPAAAGHGHASRPHRRRPDPGRGGDGRNAGAARRAVPAGDRRRRRRPVRPRGRRGGGPSCASSWRRCSACSTAARWGRRWRSGSPTGSSECATSSPPSPHDEVERFVLRMPRGYFLSVEPGAGRAALRDDRAAARAPTRSGRRPSTAPGPARTSCSSSAADRPGLLSWIAGCALARRALDPHRAGVHDRRRRGRRTCSRSRGRSSRRSARSDGASSATCSARRSRVGSRSSTGWRRSAATTRRRERPSPVTVTVDNGASRLLHA